GRSERRGSAGAEAGSAARPAAERPALRRARAALCHERRGPDGDRGDRRGDGAGDLERGRPGREPLRDGEALRVVAGFMPAAPGLGGGGPEAAGGGRGPPEGRGPGGAGARAPWGWGGRAATGPSTPWGRSIGASRRAAAAPRR